MTEQEAIEAAQEYIGRCLALGKKNGVEDPDFMHEDHNPSFQLFEIETYQDCDEDGDPASNWEVTIRFPKKLLVYSDTDRVEVTILNDL